MIASTIYNMMRGKGSTALLPDDFIGPADPVERQAREAANLSEKIKAALKGRERK